MNPVQNHLVKVRPEHGTVIDSLRRCAASDDPNYIVMLNAEGAQKLLALLDRAAENFLAFAAQQRAWAGVLEREAS